MPSTEERERLNAKMQRSNDARKYFLTQRHNERRWDNVLFVCEILMKCVKNYFLKGNISSLEAIIKNIEVRLSLFQHAIIADP